jgi:hypothetical protein
MLIYCLDPQMMPTSDEAIEEIIYSDMNDFQWKISRTELGFFIKFLSDPYFMENRFDVFLTNGDNIWIKNTNCIFIEDTDFQTFLEIREKIKNNYTDDIWEYIEDMFQDRFWDDETILDSESNDD